VFIDVLPFWGKRQPPVVAGQPPILEAASRFDKCIDSALPVFADEYDPAT